MGKALSPSIEHALTKDNVYRLARSENIKDPTGTRISSKRLSKNGVQVMGAIAAVVDKRGGNAVPKVVSMLKKLKHRGNDAHGVAIPTAVEIAQSLEKLEDTNLSSHIAIGYNLCRNISGDAPQPILRNGYALVFDGRFFPSKEKTSIEEASSRLKNNLEENARCLLKEHDGAYAFIVSHSDRMIAGRDVLGIIPLYYGENENICGLASERKALWALGIRTVDSFPPGNLAIISAQGFTFEKASSIVQPPIKPLDMDAAAKRLSNLIFESTVERVKDIKRLAVAFSGGLDSAVVALLAKMGGVDVHLISVGLENQQELRHAETAGRAMELPIQIQAYDMSDVEKAVSKVLWLIEEPDPMKIGVAIPFFWTAETASKVGCRVLLAGQGGDELFGGYQRYLTELNYKGAEALQKILYQDVISSYTTNLQRDHAVCAFHKVELRLPFLDREVVNFALSLPLKLKIESAKDLLQKRVLRVVAKNLGLPDFVAKRPKKAVQYATGVQKALKRFAKRENLTLSDYLKQLFRKVYPDLEESL
jgi:asparagine synthase (glutamine-hydrolysing)